MAAVLRAAFALAAAATLAAAFVPKAPADLRTNFLPLPLGVDVTPFFSWTPNDPDHVRLPPAAIQSAYQIALYSEDGRLLWDTLRVLLPNNAIPYVYYTGIVALARDTQYSWRVRIWGNESAASEWSPPAYFVTGVDSPFWAQARWVSGPMLRRSFVVPSGSKVRRATAFVCGIGYHHLWVDGAQAGGEEHTLSPTTSNFNKRAHYLAYDVTELLAPGETQHVVGLTLGHGFHQATPRAIMVLRVHMDDGTLVQVVTDDKWLANPAPPIVSDSLYNGETYDARLEVPGWATPSCKTCDSWVHADTANFTDTPVLSAQLSEGIRPVQNIRPVALSQPSPGEWVFDMGQNFAGWTRLKVSGPAGTTVRTRHAEALMHPPYGPQNGSIYVANLRTALATDIYILRGEGVEEHEPCFTYHGFRFVEVTGLPEGYVPTLETITGVFVHSAVRRVSTIGKQENRILEQIQQNTLWAAASNLYGIPTDCPQRDERRGWLGDAALASASDLLHWDMRAFYTTFLRLIEDEQTSSGSLPFVAPDNGAFFADKNFGADLDWTTAFPTLSWGMVKYGGATPGIFDRWSGLTKYMNYLDHLHSYSGLVKLDNMFGDWCSPIQSGMPGNMGHCGPTSQQQKSATHLMSSATYIRDVKNMADLATALGKTAEALKYKIRYSELADEFNAAFFDKEGKTYADGSQVALTLPLWLGIVPEDDREAVFNNLVESIVVENKNHVVVGIIGMRYIYEVLCKYGRPDLALIASTQISWPSFGAQILSQYEPATTLWELWDSDTREAEVTMNSRNHIMFNGVDLFLMKAVGGLDMAEDALGWSRLVIRPQLVFVEVDGQSVTGSDVKIETPRGTAAVSWKSFENSTLKNNMAQEMCTTADENTVMQLECGKGERISKINFASYGAAPDGSCKNPRSLARRGCSSSLAKEMLSKLCVGHRTCPVIASNAQFGMSDPCPASLDNNVLVASWECSAKNHVGENVAAKVDITVPATSEADVYIPKPSGAGFTISVDGVVVWSNSMFLPAVDGVILAEDAGSYVRFETLSGQYSFSISITP